MNENISSLLFYPFDKEQIAYPNYDAKTLFWGAQYFYGIEKFKNIDCVQSFKPDAALWEGHGIKIQSELLQQERYQNIFCHLPKQKESALYMLAQSLDYLEDNGLLVAVAANDAGGKKIESWMKELGANPTSLSKSKCRIVWAYKNTRDQQKIDFYISKGAQQNMNIDGLNFMSQPGIFGWDKIDKGSKLLIQNLPPKLEGKGADFGCGYGYLSSQVLKKHTNINKLYALDADYNALQCAKKNLAHYQENIDIEYDWVDLTVPQKDLRNLDWIVMNPPFHEGKQAKNEVGHNFIKQAAQCLKKSGSLYMVANSHLPYEKLLDKLFSNVHKVSEEQGYKIFVVQK